MRFPAACPIMDSGDRMRLLLAEDELDLAEALTVFFEKNQFTVDAVHDGAAAYDYACTGSYDAVILDIMMPKMDGIQVLRKLREDGVSTPIMMLTAKAEKDDRIVGFDAGAVIISRRCCPLATSPWTAAQASSAAKTPASNSAAGNIR